MPSLPTAQGLVCQGWNYTLQQMKSTLSACGSCYVGAVYTTDDGRTRFNITIRDKKYSSFSIMFTQSAANGVEFDWGDGSEKQTYSGTSSQTVSHSYIPTSYPQ